MRGQRKRNICELKRVVFLCAALILLLVCVDLVCIACAVREKRSAETAALSAEASPAQEEEAGVLAMAYPTESIRKSTDPTVRVRGTVDSSVRVCPQTVGAETEEEKTAVPETEDAPNTVPAAGFAGKLPDWIETDIIPLDGASRTGIALEGVKDIVIHYVGNPGTTAEQNRGWYVNEQSDVSSHFIVGLDGEILQCIPLDEKSCATNWRNKDTISIETCHPDSSGKFNKKTYASLVRLTAWLCDAYGLDTEHVIRHYDVTEKICPKYFVEHEDAWEQFKEDVEESLDAMD